MYHNDRITQNACFGIETFYALDIKLGIASSNSNSVRRRDLVFQYAGCMDEHRMLNLRIPRPNAFKMNNIICTVVEIMCLWPNNGVTCQIV